MKRHERELHDLAIGHGVEGKPSNASVGISSVDTVAVNASATDNVSTRETYVYPEGNWSSLSKKELEMEAHKRGLGRKGNREELITKLMVFHTDQRRKIEAGELDPNNKPPPSKKSSQTRSFFSALSNFECDNNELAQVSCLKVCVRMCLVLCVDCVYFICWFPKTHRILCYSFERTLTLTAQKQRIRRLCIGKITQNYRRRLCAAQNRPM